MLGSLIGGAISGIGKIFGASVDYKNNKRLMALQNEYNTQQAQLQNEMNVANWQMQNEYNTPANQMKRLQEAGLNPNLIYGNGQTSTGNANALEASVGYPSATAQASNFGDLGMADAARTFMQMEQTNANIDVLNSQVQKNEAETQVALQEALNKQTSRALQDLDLHFARDSYGSRLAYLSLGNASLEQNMRESQSRVELNSQERLNKVATYQEIQSRTGLNLAQTTKAFKEIDKISQDIAESISREMLNYAKTKGQNISNEINGATIAQQQSMIRQALAESIVRTESGHVSIDKRKADAEISRLTADTYKEMGLPVPPTHMAAGAVRNGFKKAGEFFYNLF